MKRTVDMTVGSPTKHIIFFALPLILANLGQQFYQIVDAVIVGRGVGVHALAAVGATDWSYWLILWTMSGLTQGFSTFVSQYFGDKNYNDMNKTIAMSVILCAVIGGILTAAGIFLARPLLTVLNTPNDIINDAALYLITMLSGTLIIMAYNLVSAILRAFGDGKTPLVAMIIAASLNIGLDCLFVFVFKWGIFGAALASVLSQLISFIYCLTILIKIDCINLSRDMWSIDMCMIKRMLLFGLPVSLQYVIIALGGIILQSAINLQGSIFIAGYTATNKVYSLLESSAISFGLASCTFIAQNYGARLYGRVKNGVMTSLKIMSAIAIVITVSTLLMRKYIIQLFLDLNEAGGAEALDIAVRYLTIMSPFLIILYLIHVFRNALQAIGIARWSMVSGIVEFITRAGMSTIVINWIGSDALFISEPVAWFGATLSVMLPYLYYRKRLLIE